MTISWREGVRDPARIAAVARADLTVSGSEDEFDRLTELAVELIGVPRACITVLDAERNTPKSAIGFPSEGVPAYAPIELSFCRFVVGSGRPLVVDNSREDPRTIGDPAIAAFGAVTWAGYPIEDADGHVLGTFCLMDDHPHIWTGRDLLVLATLAKAASTEIALRGARAAADEARADAARVRSAALQATSAIAEFARNMIDGGPPFDVVGQKLLDCLESASAELAADRTNS